MMWVILTLVLMPPELGKRVDPVLNQASTSAAAPRPSLESNPLVLEFQKDSSLT
jgi:hypothetical protein